MMPQMLEEIIRWSVEATINEIIYLLWGLVYATVFIAWHFGGYLLVIALAGYILYQLARSAKEDRR